MPMKLGADTFAKRNDDLRRVDARSVSAGMAGMARKPRTYLSGDFAKDMKELRIRGNIRNAQTRRDEYRDETPQFVTYLTLALQNISEILGRNVDLSGQKRPETVAKALADSGRLYEVASFLWLHRVNEPQFDYGQKKDAAGRTEYEKFAHAVVLKLWELRNMFVHSTQPKAAKVLVVQPDFYRFVEGELYSEAREHALGPGRKSEKAFKLKLFTPHNDERSEYEFTRRGLVFLVCLALYRHDAAEFLQQFRDMQLPPRAWEVEQGYVEAKSEKELVELRKKGGSVKAILDAFTFYSMRSSRTDIDVENADYLNFANILLYLKKVPSASFAYLSLEDESKRMKAAGLEAEKQGESEKNRRFRYVLQERRKDRFLTLALAYIEDFKVLECLKFKRLDVTVRPDRKRYLFGRIPADAKNEFGEPISDANGMDRHYAIVDGVAQFEFTPDSHYGDIKVDKLRGGIGENEIMRLLLVLHGKDKSIRPQDAPRVIRDYLTAYHRILERMLNAPDTSALSLDDPQFRADFKTVSGKGDAALDPACFVEEMKPFFPANLTRFFVGAEGRPGVTELQRRLDRRLTAMADRAGDFLVKMDKLTDWRALDEEACKREGFPVCAVGELKYPPRTCRINDAQLVRMVLKYINLNLTAANKFRQLPRGMRHRGVRDFEFQLLHADIGRFGTDPTALWRTLEKREGLNGSDGPLEYLKNRERELFREEERRCRGKRDRNGRPLRVGHTLTMLATAAAELYQAFCADLRAAWCGDLSEEDAELLPYVAPMYGVKAGLPLDRAALVKTILGIDLEKWTHAYDYARGRPYENRTLAGAPGLVAAQIPVPNDLARRCVAQPADGAPFLFNPAFRSFLPYEKGKMSLRAFYDVAPLIGYVKTHGRSDAAVDPQAPGVETRWAEPTAGDADDETLEYGKPAPRRRTDFTRNEVNRAIQAIQRAERQDKVLLACAKAYWDRYMQSEVTANDKKNKKDKIKEFRLAECESVANFFDTKIEDTVSGVKIRMMPNDFARPAYGVVAAHVAELVKMEGVKPLKDTDHVYAFYDLWLALRDLQRRENTVRLRYLPAVVNLLAHLDIPAAIEDLPDSDPEKLPRTLAHCQRQLPGKTFSETDYWLVVNLYNRLRHPATKDKSLLSFDLASADALLKRLGFPPVRR